MIKGSLGGETSVLRTFRMSGKELVNWGDVSEGKKCRVIFKKIT